MLFCHLGWVWQCPSKCWLFFGRKVAFTSMIDHVVRVLGRSMSNFFATVDTLLKRSCILSPLRSGKSRSDSGTVQSLTCFHLRNWARRPPCTVTSHCYTEFQVGCSWAATHVHYMKIEFAFFNTCSWLLSEWFQFSTPLTCSGGLYGWQLHTGQHMLRIVCYLKKSCSLSRQVTFSL